MTWFTGVVLYILIWWVSLFAVLPFGAQPDPGPDSATGWRGAPRRPRMGMKILATTLVAAVIFGACLLVINSDWLSFRHGFLAMPHD